MERDRHNQPHAKSPRSPESPRCPKRRDHQWNEERELNDRPLGSKGEHQYRTEGMKGRHPSSSKHSESHCALKQGGTEGHRRMSDHSGRSHREFGKSLHIAMGQWLLHTC